MKLSDVAAIVNGMVYGKGNFEIKNILPPEDAGKNDLAFLLDTTKKTRAGAVITDKKIKGKNGVIVANPKKAMYLLLKSLVKVSRKREISPRAIIAANVILRAGCVVEPFAVIKPLVKLGSGTYIGANCYIDDGVIIGKNCEIRPHTTIYKNTKIGDFVVIDSNSVIGKEGFGYIKKKRYERIRHIGGVIIKNFIEVGANVAIDRGTVGNTIIGEGTKIDNLVHIGHNVKIGKNCIIMGQVGIAGSTVIGDNVILCGQVGISDHLNIADNVIVYAKSGVFKSLCANKRYSGIPAREHDMVLKAVARLYRRFK